MKIPKLDRFRIAMGAGILLVVAIVGGVGWAFFQQLALAEELGKETRQLEDAVATQRAEQAYLTATLTYVQTDEYVEEWARERAKMTKPGEVLVIPVGESEDAGSGPSASTRSEDAAASVPEDRPFWVLWWEALIGLGK